MKKFKLILQTALLALAVLSPDMVLAQAPAPASLTAISGATQALLSWPGSTGAASYNVQRATNSGGPYALLVNVNSTTRSYTDSAVTNGVEHYYVVAAVSNSVAGANSPEAAAIPLANDAFYVFFNRLSGLALTASNGLAVQEPYSGATNQFWRFASLEAGYFALLNGLGAGATLTGPTASAQLTASSFTGANDQLWSFQVTNGFYFLVQNLGTGQVLDDLGASLANGTPVGQWVPDGATNQNWVVVYPTPPGLTGVTLTNNGPATEYTFSGQVNPNGLPTTLICSLGTNTSYGISVTTLISASLTPASFSITVTDVVESATLHGEVTAQNAAGSVSSGDLTVSANIGSPLFESALVTNDDQVSQAYVSALINPDNLPTTVVIQFGTNTAYGQAVTTTLASANSYQAVNETFSYPSLNVTTTLHAFITASNSAGITTSGDLACSSLWFEKKYSSDWLFGGTNQNALQPQTGSAVWADLDNDGWLDLACTGQSSLQVGAGGIFWNPGTNQTGWVEDESIPIGSRAALAVGDFDNDNRPDLFFACGTFPPVLENGVGGIFGGEPGATTGIVYGDDGKFTGDFYIRTNSSLMAYLYVQDASVAVGDFDHTGRQDALVSGYFETSNNFAALTSNFSLLCQNNLPGGRLLTTNIGNAPFNQGMAPVNTSLPYLNGNPVYFSSGQAVLVAGDFDNDGFPDLFALNFFTDTTHTPYAGFFHGDGNKNFTPTSRFQLYPGTSGDQFSTIETASCVLADMNGDGYLDMVLSYGNQLGVSGGIGPSITTVGIWLNDGHGNLTNSGIVLPQQLQLANLAVGDIFNHGRNDILIVGCIDEVDQPNVMQTMVLRNDGNGVFTPIVLGNFGCIGETGHGLQLADYDNDGRLDFAMTGDNFPSGVNDGIVSGFAPATHIFRNEMNIPSNAPPAAPPGLGTTVGNGTVRFHWGNATDDITPANLLTYNLRVGTNSLDTSVVSPIANVTNGWRKIVAPGNCGHTTNTLYRFPPGTYYWSVQAVDGGYKGGAWAPEQTFTITNPEPVVLALNQPANQPYLNLAGGDPAATIALYQEQLSLMNDSTNVLNLAVNTNLWNLSWPTRFKGYTLEQATNLANPVWTTNTPPIGTLDGAWSVLVTNSSSGSMYYRLVK